MAPKEREDANERGKERHLTGGGLKVLNERPGKVHLHY